MSNFIGPALPAHLLDVASSDDSKFAPEPDDTEIGPSLPPRLHLATSKSTASNSLERGPPNLKHKQITQSEMSEDSTDDLIGPTIPPHLESGKERKGEKIICPAEQELKVGPTLPPKLRSKHHARSLVTSESSEDESTGKTLIGPSLPPSLQDATGSSEDEIEVKSKNVSFIGPTLPPFLLGSKGSKQKVSSVIGPALPSFVQHMTEEEPVTVGEESVESPVIGPSLPSDVKLGDAPVVEDDGVYGPALPPGFKPKTVVDVDATDIKGSDDETIGPLPEGALADSSVQEKLELRARHLRQVMASGVGAPSQAQQRESWMLELPADRAPELGLRPRQFRLREAPEAGDRSVWTDTPTDKERKKSMPKTSPDRGVFERQTAQERDEMMQHLAEQHGSKRTSRSLLEMHTEKLEAKRRKAEEEGEVAERRPFSREVDLQVNRFDEAQKRSIVKKAQNLNDRFSAGQSKFL